jgi:hypothetical protein
MLKKEGAIFKYVWHKKTYNGTEKHIAILEISNENEFINSLIATYGGKSPIVWVFIAIALHSYYPGIFPPIWDDWGNLNAFWGSSDLLDCDNDPEMGCEAYVDYPLPTFRI